jgi:hypothetical protein
MFSAFIIIAVLCLYGRSVVKLLFSTTGKREFYPEFRVFLGNGISYRSDEAFNYQVHVDVYEHVRVRVHLYVLVHVQRYFWLISQCQPPLEEYS